MSSSDSDSDSEEEMLLLVYLLNTMEIEKIRRRLRQRISVRNAEVTNRKSGETIKNVILSEKTDGKIHFMKEKIAKRKREDLLHEEKERRKRRPNEEVAKINREYGTYHRVKELITDEEIMFNNLNITPVDFQEILEHIRDDIQKKHSADKKVMSPEIRLAITLSWLRTGGGFRKIHKSFLIGRSTVSCLVREVCSAIYKRLHCIVMPQPSMEMLCESALHFEEKWQFPNCAGVLNGRHILLGCGRRRFYETSDIVNYNAKCSIVIFGIADARNCFLAVRVLPGDQSEVEAFQNSLLDSMLPEDNMPPPKLLPQSGIFLPYVILTNKTFPHTKYLMTPYPSGTVELCPEKGVYNDKHYRALKVCDDTFGLMASRYKVFESPLVVTYDTAIIVTKACCCLHNFLRQKEIARNNIKLEEGFGKQELAQAKALMPLAPYLGAASHTGLEVRENFLIHFLSDLPNTSGPDFH